MDTTVLLVDDHAVFRIGLKLLLADEAGIQVVGEAGDGQAAITGVQELSPDVVVMDIAMPGMDGIEATRQIKSEFPQTNIIALSIHGEKDFVEEMLGAGVTGYVLKENAPEDLVPCIHAVRRGKVFLSSSIKDVVVSQYMDRLADTGPLTDKRARNSLLTTKIHRPHIAHHTVLRTRLIEQLEEGRGLPLTLVSAPAGYGKSTLLGQWLEQCDLPSAWLSLDERDNDLRLFVTYLVEAVRSQFPEALRETSILVKTPNSPPLHVLARTLVNDLDRLPQRFILVLDDYHRIDEPAIHELLGELLRHPPQSLHLVLSSRTDPSLDLLQLRAYRQMGEVRTQGLSFTVEETMAYLENIMGSSVEVRIAKEIAEKTEGWVTGLHLITLSLHDGAGLANLSTILPGEQQTLDYLAAEALTRQTREIQSWLLKTSILDRFCAPLCEAVCGEPGEDALLRGHASPGEHASASIDGQAFLGWLRERNLFVIPLDSQERWFRYHHLFRQLLQNQLANALDGGDIAALHGRVSVWFGENDLIDEALQFALIANDIPYAVHLVEQHRYDLMNTEQWRLLERRLKKLPPETVAKNPTLLMAQAYLYDYRGQIAESFACRDRAEAVLSALPPEYPERKAVQGEIAALYGEQYILTGEAQLALEQSELALDLLPVNALHIWSFAIGEQVLAYQMVGDISQGFAIINRILKNRTSLPPISEARMMLWFCLAYWMEGDTNSLKTPAHRCLKLGEQYKLSESHAFGRFFLGAGHYARHELTEAERYLAALVDNPFTVRPLYLLQGAFILALIHRAHGREENAADVIASVIAHSAQTNDTFGQAIIRAFQVELALLQGNVSKAQRLNENAVYDLILLIWFPYIPQLTPVKLLLAENTAQSLEKGLNELDKLDEFVRKMNRKNIMLDVLALKALILDAQGKEPAALQALTESLILGERGGFIRNYVDLGPRMADLLARLHSQGVAHKSEAVPYIDQILAAFAEDKAFAEGEAEADVQHVATAADTSYPLGASLTKREQQVLLLLATTLSPEEIADELTVSVATVRTHTKRIYSKLGAHTRMDAVAAAHELGLL